MILEYNYENFNKLNRIFDNIVGYNYLNEIIMVYDSLNALLTKEKERQDPILYKKYKHLKNKYGFACLASLAEDEILELLENHLAVIFEINDYDLWINLKKYLVIFSDYKERDRLKGVIKNILIKNKAKITKTGLLINNKEVIGTVDNWLRDYHIYLGLGPADRLKFEEYFSSSPNIKRATVSEKKRLKSLFEFYEKLKLSSNSPQGFEERVPIKINGELKIWKDGFLEDIDSTVKKSISDLKALGFFKDKIEVIKEKGDLNQLKQLAESYPAGSFERKVIEEEIEKMKHE